MPGYVPSYMNMPLSGNTSDIAKNQIRQQQQEYNQYSPQFGNIALNGAMSNPAAGMFSPEQYSNQQNEFNTGVQGAEFQQAGMGQNADQLEAGANDYDKFASGVGGQLAPGLQKQQQNADNQQSQADWLWKNPGYTDQEKQSMQTAAGTPIAGAYTAQQGDLRNTAARTGNSAAYGAQASDLARNKARDMSMAGLNMQGNFAGARIAGQQYANQAQGQAGGAQAGVNNSNQAAAGLQSNIFNTGSQMRQGVANTRMGTAGSMLQRAGTANQGQQTMQNAQALSMAPAQLAAGMYGTLQGARNQAGGTQAGIVNNAQNNSFGTAMAKGLGGALGGVKGSYSSTGGWGVSG